MSKFKTRKDILMEHFGTVMQEDVINQAVRDLNKTELEYKDIARVVDSLPGLTSKKKEEIIGVIIKAAEAKRRIR